MNEAEIRACGGDLVAAVRPHVMDGIREEDREVADRIFTATTTLLLQVLVDINRIATAVEPRQPIGMGIYDGKVSAEPISAALAGRFGLGADRT